MKRATFFRLWPTALLLLTGCGDSMPAVMRDYYNVQHEILDNMVMVVDEASAKKFNENYTNRLQKKEEVIKTRKEKVTLTNSFTAADRDAMAKLLIELDTVTLKSEAGTLDKRFRILQNRHRRLIVKLVEDKANDEMRTKTDTFTVKSKEVCPELSDLAMPEKFSATNESVGGGLGGGGMAGMAGPGGAANPGGAAGAAGAGAAGAGGEQKKKTARAVDPRANSKLGFSITCVRVGNEWQQTRRWGSGSKGIEVPLVEEGVDLIPLFP